ncbi:hypothetical protein CA600_12600 [Paenibacillus sp. VTT E-133280]|uniref:hypothetical protein n=1 Tax=Paenibacillus sp. VTT E-133280 TaxID=1986222 RepID=UPI000BA02063|nr:hypothetical protein [Paenibacillus sp. VTT E-133280]OZQ66093.1 hypothetical protein CA600_12600 [Paenibacillus sp. VTT E-133280]
MSEGNVSLTAERIAEIKGLLAKATPGPWKWINEGSCLFPECGADYGDYILFVQKSGLGNSSDAPLISAAPTVIAELLVALEESQKEAEKNRKVAEAKILFISQGNEDYMYGLQEDLAEAQQTIALKDEAIRDYEHNRKIYQQELRDAKQTIARQREHIKGIHRIIVSSYSYTNQEELRSVLTSAEWACAEALNDLKVEEGGES